MANDAQKNVLLGDFTNKFIKTRWMPSDFHLIDLIGVFVVM
jgi:hypothetical protein